MSRVLRHVLLTACLLTTGGLVAAPKTVAGLPAAKALALGEQMFRKGILPSGQELQARVKGDIRVPGSAFACSSCHLRSGLGSIEGGVFTLPTNGAKLAQPLFLKSSKIPPADREAFGIKTLPKRPPYTDATLAAVIRTCVDPTGRELNPVMPRYELTDRDMEILVHYLKNLSSKLSPGASLKLLRFATVITEEVRPEDREAMLLPLENFVLEHNRRAGNFDNKMYVFGSGPEMMLSYRPLALDRWELKGPRSTWRRQLEAYNRKQPAFALLGGISYGSWQPIHDFAEAFQIPCLFPITDYPVLSDSDWYTLYLSKGLQQEGQAAARYLKNALPKGRIVQVVRDAPEGRALAAGFQESWSELEGQPFPTVLLPAKAALTETYLRTLIQKEQAAAVVLWTGAEAFPALAALAADAPAFVVMSSSYLKQQLTDLPEPARGFTYVTYPYRHPDEEGKYSPLVNHLLAGYTTHHPETRISTRMYSLTQVLTTALMDMEQNLYRDTFLDVIGMQRDQALPDYERLSFGPGQRYASKGCYIMQLSAGPTPKLLKKTTWVSY
jgi:ABC-type branched-subunit amino acid transport system substrate-binding protein